MMRAKLTYSVNETARLLGISRGLAYEMVHCGKIPALRFGKRLVIPRSAIERLLQGPISEDPSTSKSLSQSEDD